jgi:hypothetical protein
MQFPKIYHKLFWGNNLPPVTPEGCHFNPEWSRDELAALAGVLSAGLEMFQFHTRPLESPGVLG